MVDNGVSLKADAGREVNVVIQQSARILRAEPWMKDLKDATLITLKELKAGERVPATSKPRSDGGASDSHCRWSSPF
jgi:hypothetical protein